MALIVPTTLNIGLVEEAKARHNDAPEPDGLSGPKDCDYGLRVADE